MRAEKRSPPEGGMVRDEIDKGDRWQVTPRQTVIPKGPGARATRRRGTASGPLARRKHMQAKPRPRHLSFRDPLAAGWAHH